jgi:tRNA pseudouridine55 synthase
MDAILLIDKPEGLTSAEVVRRVKRRVPVKVGHLGTLDPFATGLLPLCLGEATKIAQFLNTADKRYDGTIQLGQATDTGDRTGQPTRSAALPDLATIDFAALAQRFIGEQLQRPPMYSAIKHSGVPLYRLARQGKEVERAERRVRIDELTIEALPPDRLRFTMACSKGTYVRVLAEDLGAALDSAAHLDALRRTKFGNFVLSEAVRLDEWSPTGSAGRISLLQALAHLPSVPVDAETAVAIRHGKSWPLTKLPTGIGEHALLLGQGGVALAVVARTGGTWGYARVLSPDPSFTLKSPCVSHEG